ncbi:MAG: hypothetical protein U5L10_03060 [Candidatus Moranbacteria bacterium]|nr:hypothetical protein [Candidatus Moranbacteria bacterium]
MKKQELLEEISQKVSSGELDKDDVLEALEQQDRSGESQEGIKKWFSQFSITKALYLLGVAIAIIGIIIFIAQIWEDIGSFGRISTTLLLGLMIAAIGSVLFKKDKADIGSLFHVMSGILIPMGVMVLLSELNSDIDSFGPLALSFGIIFLFYLLLNYIHQKIVLTFFSILNGTVFIYTLFGALLKDPPEDFIAYLAMAIGVSYLLLARQFRSNWNNKLEGVLNFFGILGLLGAAFTQVFDSGVWQMLYFPLAIGGLYLSTYINSRAVLGISTIFLLAHLVYITAEYFADSIGWPISLILLGFLFIALGYMSVSINKKYIKD